MWQTLSCHYRLIIPFAMYAVTGFNVGLFLKFLENVCCSHKLVALVCKILLLRLFDMLNKVNEKSFPLNTYLIWKYNIWWSCSKVNKYVTLFSEKCFIGQFVFSACYAKQAILDFFASSTDFFISNFYKHRMNNFLLIVLYLGFWKT